MFLYHANSIMDYHGLDCTIALTFIFILRPSLVSINKLLFESIAQEVQRVIRATALPCCFFTEALPSIVTACTFSSRLKELAGSPLVPL